MDVTFSRLAASPAGLSPAEAVALALAAAGQIPDAAYGGLPGTDDIFLSGDGLVSFGDGYIPEAESDPASWLAARTRDLLALDSVPVRDGRSPIPGGLLLLLARASGQIDLAPPSFPALLGELRRFGSDDPDALRAIYRTHAGEVAYAP